MNETETTATPATPAAPKAKAAKKPAKKAAAKKAKPGADGDRIARPQLRILAALAKAKRPMGKAELSKACGVHMNWVAEYVGTPGDFAARVSGDGPRKLAAAGLAKALDLDVD